MGYIALPNSCVIATITVLFSYSYSYVMHHKCRQLDIALIMPTLIFFIFQQVNLITNPFNTEEMFNIVHAALSLCFPDQFILISVSQQHLHLLIYIRSEHPTDEPWRNFAVY